MRSGKKLTELYTRLDSLNSAAKGDRGFSNLLGYESKWPLYAHLYDFLDPASPNHFIKLAQTEIYLKYFRKYFTFTGTERVLDLGCGNGRFAVRYADKVKTVDLVDGSRNQLMLAERSLKQLKLKNYSLHCETLDDYGTNLSKRYNTVFAMESLCYTEHWRETLDNIGRMTRPGATLFLSAENRFGSAFSDEFPVPGALRDIYTTGDSYVDGYLYVRYFEVAEMAALLDEIGFDVLKIGTLQFLIDGPFERWVDKGSLGKSAYRRRIVDLDIALSDDPNFAHLGRAVCVVARRR